jgi:hypothetical protein
MPQAGVYSRLRFDSPLARAKYLQQHSPLVDGHNDLPWALRQMLNNNLTAINLDQVQSGPWASHNLFSFFFLLLLFYFFCLLEEVNVLVVAGVVLAWC